MLVSYDTVATMTCNCNYQKAKGIGTTQFVLVLSNPSSTDITVAIIALHSHATPKLLKGIM